MTAAIRPTDRRRSELHHYDPYDHNPRHNHANRCSDRSAAAPFGRRMRRPRDHGGGIGHGGITDRSSPLLPLAHRHLALARQAGSLSDGGRSGAPQPLCCSHDGGGGRLPIRAIWSFLALRWSRLMRSRRRAAGLGVRADVGPATGGMIRTVRARAIPVRSPNPGRPGARTGFVPPMRDSTHPGVASPGD
jgi:hypothetical protein